MVRLCKDVLNRAYGVSCHEACHLHFIMETGDDSGYKQSQYHCTGYEIQTESMTEKH